MIKYLDLVRKELAKFEVSDIMHVIRGENTQADALAKLATSKD